MYIIQDPEGKPFAFTSIGYDPYLGDLGFFDPIPPTENDLDGGEIVKETIFEITEPDVVHMITEEMNRHALYVKNPVIRDR